ncbi:WhiB family transcriptional regulator [Planomonospora algeriensis]
MTARRTSARPGQARRGGVRQAVLTWHDRAACKDVDVAVFANDTEPHRDGSPRAPYDDAAAKAHCGRCPVRKTCLEDALSRGDLWLTRGGMNSDELRSEKRRRARKGSAA